MMVMKRKKIKNIEVPMDHLNDCFFCVIDSSKQHSGKKENFFIQIILLSEVLPIFLVMRVTGMIM